jgi:hypothetical protein
MKMKPDNAESHRDAGYARNPAAWRPISAAKKNGETIWAAFRSDLDVISGREDLKRWNGKQVPLRHQGLADDGFDIGWSLDAPVGYGGFPDDWIAGWLPLPANPGQQSLSKPKDLMLMHEMIAFLKNAMSGTEGLIVREVPAGLAMSCAKYVAQDGDRCGVYLIAAGPEYWILAASTEADFAESLSNPAGRTLVDQSKAFINNDGELTIAVANRWEIPAAAISMMQLTWKLCALSVSGHED